LLFVSEFSTVLAKISSYNQSINHSLSLSFLLQNTQSFNFFVFENKVESNLRNPPPTKQKKTRETKPNRRPQKTENVHRPSAAEEGRENRCSGRMDDTLSVVGVVV
jgi:hypothetical protein